MTYNDPTPADPRSKGWGATGLFVVGLVVVLALILTFLGPTDTQQASNVPASPPASDIPQPAQ
jgi:hypothetical protein